MLRRLILQGTPGTAITATIAHADDVFTETRIVLLS